MSTRLLCLLTLFILAACGAGEPGGAANPASEANEPARPLVVASNYPLYFFATEIAGDSVRLELPEIEGDPAGWKPDADDVALLQSADLVLLNGAGYEAWLSWVTLPEDRLLDTTGAVRERLIPLQQETVHQHGPEGEHSHAGHAFTTWLDPGLAAEQAAAVAGALAALQPAGAAEYQQRLERLRQRLAALDQGLQSAFDALGDEPLLFSHPVYQYLEARYGLDGASLHWEPETAPGMSDWVDFQAVARKHPARLMIWEGEPLPETAQRLGEMGIRTLVFDTVSNRAGQADYFERMERNRSRLQSAGSSRTIVPSPDGD